jgi:hypothetical protein
MDLETILNDCLNKAICQNGVKHKDSNSIAEFVTNYLREGINIEASTRRVEVCKHSMYDLLGCPFEGRKCKGCEYFVQTGNCV